MFTYLRQKFWDALTYLGENTLFCLSVVFCAAVVVLVPQIKGVMLQTVEMSRLTQTKAETVADQPADAAAQGTFDLKSTLEAGGFLVYLSVLFAGAFAAINWVLPTSWFNRHPNLVPLPVAPRPGRKRIISASIAVLAVFVFVLLPVSSWLGTWQELVGPWLTGGVLLGLMVLVYPLQRWAVDRLCRAFYGRFGTLAVKDRWMRGVAMIVLGCVALGVSAMHGPFETSSLQADHLLPLAGAGLLLVGIWWVLPGGRLHLSFGRLLAWLLISFLFGEAVWFGAECPGVSKLVSYRLYTIWAVLQILVLLIEVAAFLDILEKNTPIPCRVLGVVGLVALFFVLRVPFPESMRDLDRSATNAEVAEDAWAEHFLKRIESVPDNGPVVFVAASGGGSRAAIFAGLVLEALSKEPFGKEGKSNWGQHVVLVSGVSGGSLGTARYIHGLGPNGANAVTRKDLANSVRPELASRMVTREVALRDELANRNALQEARSEEAERTYETSKAKGDKAGKESQQSEAARKEFEQQKEVVEKSRVKLQRAEQSLKFCEWFRTHAFDDLGGRTPPDGTPDFRWVVQSAIMDDLCADFMAPILRGVLTPVFSRGETLRRFWSSKFGWDGSRDRTGYVTNPEQSYASGRFPLALYNTSDVRRGCRIAVGFPPLPQRFLRTAPVSQERLFGTSDLTTDPLRNPPEVLADLDPKCTIRLADAVGLSANFPFGFNALKIERRQSEDLDDAKRTVKFDEGTRPGKDSPAGKALEKLDILDDREAKMIDGGVVDNTGIDSLFLVVESLREKAEAERQSGKPGVYIDIKNKLLSRRVFLIEIDSGAKPDKPGFATKFNSLLFDPLASLNNAGFTNAGRDKHHYIADLDARFAPELDLSDLLVELKADTEKLSSAEEDVRQKLLVRRQNGLRRFSSAKFDANSFEGDNVLTAWSLSPSDKAELLARFLLELQLQKPVLGELADLAKTDLDAQRKKARADAADLVKKTVAARKALRRQEALQKLEKDTKALARADSQKDPQKAQKSLDGVDAQVRELLKDFVTDGDPVELRLVEIQKAARDARASLAKKTPFSKQVMATLTITPEGELGKLLAAPLDPKIKAFEASLRRFEEGDLTAQVQRKINKSNAESRRTFDRPTPTPTPKR